MTTRHQHQADRQQVRLQVGQQACQCAARVVQLFRSLTKWAGPPPPGRAGPFWMFTSGLICVPRSGYSYCGSFQLREHCFTAKTIAQLRIIDFLVNWAGAHQLGVGALRCHLPLIEDHNFIGLQYRADALSHHKLVRSCISSRSASWIFVSVSTSTELVLSSKIRILGRVRISARAMAMRCFCPPDRLTPRSSNAVVVSSGRSQDKIVRLSGFGRCYHFLVAGVGTPITDIVADRAGKQDRFLRDNADVGQQRILLDGADIHAVQQNLASPRDRTGAGSG